MPRVESLPASEYFLSLNCWKPTVPDQLSFADRIVDLITGARDEAAFGDLVRSHAEPIPPA